MLLDAAATLAVAARNDSIGLAAERIANATMARLTASGGILHEPCTNCDGDQHIFKGIFARHLGYMAAARPSYAATAVNFLVNNAASLLANDACADGAFGILWEGPCGSGNTVTTASTSAALDLLVAAGTASQGTAPGAWQPAGHGLGGCVDASGSAMPACAKSGITEAACRAAASADAQATAYDFTMSCTGATTTCNVRTRGGAAACGSGFAYVSGPATSVTDADDAPLSVCFTKA